MKWTNKGHQYDEIGKHFEGGKKVYIYGAGNLGCLTYENMKFLDCVEAFVDENTVKQKNGYMDKPVISQSELLKIDKSSIIVVLAVDVNSFVYKGALRILLGSGFVWGCNLFDYHTFDDFYLGVFALYGYNKLYINKNSGIEINSICSFKCKYCGIGIPYEKKPSHRNIDEIKESIRNVFSVVDYHLAYNIGGGEALLHPEIYDILNYLTSNYQQQYGEILIYTNGLTTVDNKLLQLIKEKKIAIHWTNYTKYLHNAEIVYKIHKNVEKYKIEGIKVYTGEFLWVDYGLHTLDVPELSEEILTSKHNNCLGVGCVWLREYGLPSCGPVRELARRKLGLVFDDEITPLTSENPRHKHVLFEAYNGFTEKGYSELCKYCNGHISSPHPHIICPAEQL